MDRSRFQRKVLLDLFSSSWTLLPGGAGLSMLLLAWAAAPGTELLAFLGVSGLLAAAGSIASRWFLGHDKICRQVFDELQAEGLKKEEEGLNDLDRRLQLDDDPRPEASLRELRALYDRLKRAGDWSGKVGPAAAYEITSKVEKLFRGCIQSLERSIELWETSQKMTAGNARASVLDARERLLEEIQKSVQQMVRTMDGVQELAVMEKDDQDLARIRQELDESLEVARRVEERMQAFDAELGRTKTGSERE